MTSYMYTLRYQLISKHSIYKMLLTFNLQTINIVLHVNIDERSFGSKRDDPRT